MNIHGFISRIIKFYYPDGYVFSIMDFFEKEKRAMDEMGAAIIGMFKQDNSYKYVLKNEPEEYKGKFNPFFHYNLDLIGIRH